MVYILTLQTVMHTSDMPVMAESYRKPVFLVINKYTVPSANDDRVFIPRDIVLMIQIQGFHTKGQSTNDSNTSETETDVG